MPLVTSQGYQLQPNGLRRLEEGRQAAQAQSMRGLQLQTGQDQAAAQAMLSGAIELKGITDPAQKLSYLAQRKRDFRDRGLPTQGIETALNLARQGQWDELEQQTDYLISLGQGRQETPDIGTYNPRDYTTESFAEFTQTGDPNVLERYAPGKTFSVGGITYEYDPESGEVKQLVGTQKVAEDVEKLQEAKTRAQEQTKALVNKAVAQAGQENQLGQAEDLYNQLKDSDLSKIYGFGESLYPEQLRSPEGVTMMARRDRLIAMLKLAERGKLRGQGTISDSEQKILSDAVTILGNPNIEPEAAREALDDAMEAIYIGAGKGGEFTAKEEIQDFDLEYDPATGTFK